MTLVIRRGNEEAVRLKQPPFRAIEVISLPWLDRIHAWCFRWMFRDNYRSQVLLAFNYLFCLAFEWRAWWQTRTRIMADDFDVVLRLLPISSVLPSLFGFFRRRGPIPFVIGPIKQSNGFQTFDLPRYFIPLTRKGEWALNLCLHRGLKAALPDQLKSRLKKLREFWHRLNSR